MNKIRKIFDIDHIHKNGLKGQNVCIAVLDTGIYPHNDLKRQLILFRDFVNGMEKPYDNNSHGTHVCGIIAGNGLMSNGLYKGIAPLCSLIVLKVLSKAGEGTYSATLEAIKWILENHTSYNIKIVNISIGADTKKIPEDSDLLLKAVEKLWNKGIYVITSAGNNGPEYQTITIPGISPKVITVGTANLPDTVSSEIKYEHAHYSGKGPSFTGACKPDILAPGSNIVSCFNFRNGYAAKSGTSMSTPIVTGAAALALCKNPTLSNNDFKKLLCQSAIDTGMDIFTQGCGFLSIKNLLLLC